MRLLCTVIPIVLSGIPAFTADIPRPAPELVIKQANNQPDLLLSRFRGKVVALEFILTTCGHCQKASQVMNKVYRDFGARGLQPLSVAINDMANMFVAEFAKQYGLNFPVGYVHRDSASEFLQHSRMKSMMMPQLVIIDRKGVIRAQYPGDDKFFTGNDEQNLREALEPLLKEGMAPAKKTTTSSTTPKKSTERP